MDGINNRGVAGVNRVRQSSSTSPSNRTLANEMGRGLKNMMLGQHFIEVSPMDPKHVR